VNNLIIQYLKKSVQQWIVTKTLAQTVPPPLITI